MAAAAVTTPTGRMMMLVKKADIDSRRERERDTASRFSALWRNTGGRIYIMHGRTTAYNTPPKLQEMSVEFRAYGMHAERARGERFSATAFGNGHATAAKGRALRLYYRQRHVSTGFHDYLFLPGMQEQRAEAGHMNGIVFFYHASHVLGPILRAAAAMQRHKALRFFSLIRSSREVVRRRHYEYGRLTRRGQ